MSSVESKSNTTHVRFGPCGEVEISGEPIVSGISAQYSPTALVAVVTGMAHDAALILNRAADLIDIEDDRNAALRAKLKKLAADTRVVIRNVDRGVG